MKSHESFENKDSKFASFIRGQLELLDPNQGSILRLIVNEDINESVKKVLENTTNIITDGVKGVLEEIF